MLAFEQSLPMLLYQTLDRVLPRFRAIFKQFGLTEPQWRVLRTLWEREHVALSELAGVTLIPAPSLVGVVDRLSRDGLVERQRSATDRRVVWIQATPRGSALEAQVRPLVDQVYAELEASVDPALWTQLLTALKAFNREAGNSEQQPDAA
ncbi:MAG: MarR family transcriptional regulator [Pseudomonadota bacterium]